MKTLRREGGCSRLLQLSDPSSNLFARHFLLHIDDVYIFIGQHNQHGRPVAHGQLQHADLQQAVICQEVLIGSEHHGNHDHHIFVHIETLMLSEGRVEEWTELG